MSDRSIIEEALSKMTLDTEKNWIILNDMFKSLSNKCEKKDYLFLLTDEKYEYHSCFLAIKTLLEKGINPNLYADFHYNFVQNALYAGYEEKFIIDILEESFKHGLNPNHQDKDGDTMLHTAIYSDDYNDSVLNICNVLLLYGFDYNLKDCEDRNVVEAMLSEQKRVYKYSDDEISQVKSLCQQEGLLSEEEEKIYIDKVLSVMNYDYEKDKNLLFRTLATIGYDESRCLFGLTNQKQDENRCIFAILYLLNSCRCNPNKVDEYGYNFIQYALYAGYSSNFIMDIMEDSLINLNLLNRNMRLNINHQDKDGDTMLHTAIYSDDYKGNIADLFEFFDKFKFDFTLRDNSGKNIVEAMRHMSKKYSDKEIKEVEDLFNEKMKSIDVGGSSNDALEMVRDIVCKMTGDIEKDKDIIIEEIKYKSLKLGDLFYVLGVNYSEDSNCIACIKAILDLGTDPNYTVLNGQSSFLQKIIENGVSEEIVLWFIKENKDVLNVNYVNYEKDTVLHSAIKSKKYDGSIYKLYEALVENGFDSRVLDSTGRTIMDVLLKEQNDSGKFNMEQIIKFKKLYDEQIEILEFNVNKGKKQIIENSKKRLLKDDEIEELSGFGVVLNYKKYKTKPTIGRDKEVKNLMVTLAQEKKNPILVGESGVGKTAIVDELAYMIQNDFVPKFLKDKIILEVTTSHLVAGSKYRGQFEERMKKLLDVCKKYDLILFIDEIHTIYGAGENTGEPNDMASMIKNMIDRSGVKVIGTTTDKEYQMFFAHDALKRRFEKILVKEPDEKLLCTILNKVIDDYCIKAELSFENDEIKEKIIKALIYLTSDKNRVYNDKVNNPDLAISIIDKAFAFAMMYECENINIDNFIDSIDCCDRVYDTSKESVKKLLKEKISETKDKKAKILEADFTKFRR